MLSFWHKYISSGWTLILLASVAALFAPTFVTQKIALDAGSSIPTVFFWSVIPRGLMILILPWLIRGQRMKLLKTFRSLQWDFYLVAGIAASALFVAHTTSQLAMRHGPISLFSVVGNAQPFFVIIICYLLSLFLPERLLPKEVLSAQSLQTKAACFVVVLVGLTLFAIS